MEAKDLMIGDWVMDGDVAARVTSLTCDGIIETTFRISNVEVVEPILLTPKILEKNGWYIPDLYLWYRHLSVPFLICETSSGFRLYADEEHDKREFFCTINYVHELQHCLKLVGINKEIIL